jgi:hypothetical protein
MLDRDFLLRSLLLYGHTVIASVVPSELIDDVCSEESNERDRRNQNDATCRRVLANNETGLGRPSVLA